MVTSLTTPSSPSSPSDLRLRRRRLRLRRRRQSTTNSDTLSFASCLFARLSPSVVTALRRDALCRAAEHLNQKQKEHEEGWNIGNSNPSTIDFLPLSVKLGPGRTIYVSYNGGQIHRSTSAGNREPQDSSGEDILELQASLIPEGYADNTLVHVAALPFVQDADVLHVEPLTSEDWELLETRASYLEQGALLQQVSLVYSGQEIPLWVGDRDVAWVRILPSNFDKSEAPNSAWPDLKKWGSSYHQNSTTTAPCLRLVRDTRVSVAPKPRSSNNNRQAQWSPPLRVYTTQNDYGVAMLELAKKFDKPQVATTPGTVWAATSAKSLFPGLQNDENCALVLVHDAANGNISDDLSGNASLSCVLQLAFSDSVPENFIAIHPLTRSRLNVQALNHAVVARLLTPIEVSRASKLVDGGGGTPLSLSRVDLQEVRQGHKWRYPYMAGSLQQQLWNMPSPGLEKPEPLEDGSFVFVGNTEERILCSVSTTKTNEESRHEPPGRHFVMKHNIELMFGREAASTPWNLTSTPNLVDLLCPTSALPSSLMKINTVYDALVCGENGSGKTHSALVVASFARFARDCSTLYLDCKRLKEGQGVRMKQIQFEFRQIFHEASSYIGDVLVILDDLDELCPNTYDGASGGESAQSHQVNPAVVDQSKLLADSVRRCIEEGSQILDKNISILITCRDTRSLHPAVSSARPFTQVISAPELTCQEREELFWKMISSGLSVDDGISMKGENAKMFGLGRKTESYRPKDLVMLAFRAKHLWKCSDFGSLALCVKDALEDFTPLRHLSVSEGSRDAVEWCVGGLFEAKEALTSTILNPSKYRPVYSNAKTKLPRGVLLFGSPGCGKSHLVASLANKISFSLITCHGPELLDRYIGASEFKVRELFARASAASPAILFFDEIDSLAPRRGSDKTGVTDRVVNQLLTLLDGVEDVSAGGIVYIVAATSRPDVVDPALLRPGRLEKHVYVGYPESDDEFQDLLLKVAQSYSVDQAVLQALSIPQLMEDLKKTCPYYHRLSAADLKAAFDTAQLNVIHELLQTDQHNQKVTIAIRHLMSALRSIRPSLSEQDYHVLMETYRQFRKDAKGRPGDGDFASGTLSSRRSKLRTALR